jgi:hypothetical protein
MSKKGKKRKEWLLYAHTHRSIHVLGAAGDIILTPSKKEIEECREE